MSFISRIKSGIRTMAIPVSISLTCSMQLENESADKIFYFFKHLDRYYLDISQAHKKFKVLDGLKQGALIEVEETAGGQYVRHKYRVVKVVENRFIRLVSDPSIVEIWGGFLKVPVKTTVEFEIKPNTICSRLTLEFRSGLLHSIAKWMGVREIWGGHIKEEMEGAAEVIRSDRFIHDYK